MYHDFSPELWTKIKDALASAKSKMPADSTGQKPIAAFDADGTLWDFDLGEAFFDYQIEHCNLKLPPNPVAHYHELKKQHPPTAYLWLAQISAGHKLEQVRQWADACIEKLKPLPIFPAQQKLIQFLLQNQVEVIIVTASIKWAVEPGARLFGLSNEKVFGVQSKVSLNSKGQFIVDTEQEGPMTWKQGKAEAVMQYKKQAPFLCVGNSTGDQNLLAIASELAIAVRAHSKEEELFESEEELYQLAVKNKWETHRFR